MPATIFVPTANGYAGRVRLFGIDEAIVLVTIEPNDADNAPAWRIHLDDEDGPDIGGAWKRIGERAGDYIAMGIDSPLFPALFRPALSQADEEGRIFRLAWKRPGPREDLSSPVRVSVLPLFAGKPCSRFKMLHCSTLPAATLLSPLTPAGWRRGKNRAASRCAVLLLAGVLSVCIGSSVAVAQSVPVVRPVATDPYAADIAAASQRFVIPERWIRAVLRAESAGDVGAMSSSGATGLMQVMPDTWAGLRDRYQLGHNPWQPRDNILAGTAYLREMWDRYGNVTAMLAAYNAGPARYDEYRATGKDLPAETRAYVATLAPILGVAAASDAPARRPPAPPDWRDAPMFVLRPNDGQAAIVPSSDAQSRDARAPVPMRNPVDTGSRDSSLFAARASVGGAP